MEKNPLQKKTFEEQNACVPAYARKKDIFQTVGNAFPFYIVPENSFPDLRQAIEKIASSLPVKDRVKHSFELKLLLFNLDFSSKTAKGTFVSQRLEYWNEFNKKTKDRKISLMRLKKAIHAMIEKKYIVKIRGLHGKADQFRTTLFATEKLKKILSLSWCDFCERKNVPEIVLHDRNKNEMVIKDLPEEAEKRKEMVKRLNRFQGEHIYSFDPCVRRIRRNDGTFRMEEQHKQVRFAQTFTSIFKNSFKEGGRFYSRPAINSVNYQTMSKKQRKTIRIDGELCTELDYCSMHIAIAYSISGIKFEYKKDAYGFLPQEKRQLAKKALLISINCKSRKEAIYAFLKDPAVSEVFDYRKAKEEIFLPMEKYHMPLGNLLYKDNSCLGLHLQYLDSMLMEKVLTECMENNICALPVHDSVICKRKEANKVSSIMKNVFRQLFANKIRVAA